MNQAFLFLFLAALLKIPTAASIILVVLLTTAVLQLLLVLTLPEILVSQLLAVLLLETVRLCTEPHTLKILLEMLSILERPLVQYSIRFADEPSAGLTDTKRV